MIRLPVDLARALSYAETLAGRLYASCVSPDMLFVALTDASSDLRLTSQSIASRHGGVFDSLSAYLQASPRPILPPDLAGPVSSHAPGLLDGLVLASSESCLLSLLRRSPDEFGWYFEEAKRGRSTRRDVLVGRSALVHALSGMLAHPEYPFTDLARALGARDRAAAARVADDVDLLDYLEHKHGLDIAEILDLAGP